LVTLIGDRAIPSPYGENSDGPGRWVWVIARTTKIVTESIPYAQTLWPNAGFVNPYKNLSVWGGNVWDMTNIDIIRLSGLQIDIWN
jgi:hypothetical protein